MAARATRSASRKARLTEAVATGPLGALSHDELGVIFDGLAEPLQPVVAVALSSTCLGLRTPLQAALEVLKERHARAKAFCRKAGWNCAILRDAVVLDWAAMDLTAEDMATFGMILRTSGLPQLRQLNLSDNPFGDMGVAALCAGLGRGAAPSLWSLDICCQFGPAGAEALAAAFRRGAMPKLVTLGLNFNPLGDQGVAALAVALRQLPVLQALNLACCDVGDEGVASLVDNLGKDDFKKLDILALADNEITDAGAAKLLAAINAGGLPKLTQHPFQLDGNPTSESAVAAVEDALAKRVQNLRPHPHWAARAGQ